MNIEFHTSDMPNSWEGFTVPDMRLQKRHLQTINERCAVFPDNPTTLKGSKLSLSTESRDRQYLQWLILLAVAFSIRFISQCWDLRTNISR